jgi:glutathione S-transferase
MTIQLVLGNKNYSSWSMRAWLLLRLVDAPFEEITISLYVPGSREKVRGLGGQTGLVPVLLVDGNPIWDTLAITEYLFEQYPAVWPQERSARARARSYCGEVHSSLNALRDAMPMNARGWGRLANRAHAVEQDISRVPSIWATSGAYREGPWLFGALCAADVMFAPVASRFQTYDVSLSGQANRYLRQLLSHPLVAEWFRLGQIEPEVIEQFELPQRAP